MPGYPWIILYIILSLRSFYCRDILPIGTILCVYIIKRVNIMSQQYNVFNVLYLIFRLAPIIVISFFLLQSFFNLDPRGFVYLIGLFLASLIASTIGQFLSVGMGDDYQMGQNYKCNTMYLGTVPIESGGVVRPFSQIPLNILLYSYTFSYLFTSFVAPPVTYNNALISLQQNWTSLVLFFFLTVFEIAWLTSNSCNRFIYMWVSVVIGVCSGIAWTYLIRWTKEPRFQYTSLTNVDVCSKPSKTIYRCRNLNGVYSTKQS